MRTGWCVPQSRPVSIRERSEICTYIKVVEQRVRSVRAESKVTNPMLAAATALQHLGVRRIALLTPYIEGISNAMRALIARHPIFALQSQVHLDASGSVFALALEQTTAV